MSESTEKLAPTSETPRCPTCREPLTVQITCEARQQSVSRYPYRHFYVIQSQDGSTPALDNVIGYLPLAPYQVDQFTVSRMVAGQRAYITVSDADTGGQITLPQAHWDAIVAYIRRGKP